MAHDEYREQSDVNYIMERFNKTGEITHLTRKHALNNPNGEIFDNTKASDYYEAMQIITTATQTFMSYPADIRKKFDNDPAVMIAWLDDPKNNQEAIKLGLKEEKHLQTDQKILNELKTSNKLNSEKNKINDDKIKNPQKNSNPTSSD